MLHVRLASDPATELLHILAAQGSLQHMDTLSFSDDEDMKGSDPFLDFLASPSEGAKVIMYVFGPSQTCCLCGITSCSTLSPLPTVFNPSAYQTYPCMLPYFDCISSASGIFKTADASLWHAQRTEKKRGGTAEDVPLTGNLPNPPRLPFYSNSLRHLIVKTSCMRHVMGQLPQSRALRTLSLEALGACGWLRMALDVTALTELKHLALENFSVNSIAAPQVETAP